MDAQERAVETITAEHRALGKVVQVLQELVAGVAVQRTEADFTLFSAALYYIDEFPERMHHPKEDEYLFRAIRNRTTRFNATLDELQSDHVRSAQLAAMMQRALVHWQGGAPDGPARFRTAVEAYATMLDEHMRSEETLLAEAAHFISADDWEEIAAAFDANEDPLFGSHRREEFGRLHARILALLPRKIRMQRSS